MAVCYHCRNWDSKTERCSRHNIKRKGGDTACPQFSTIPRCSACQHFSGGSNGRCKLGLADFSESALSPDDSVCSTGNFAPRTDKSSGGRGSCLGVIVLILIIGGLLTRCAS